MSTPLRERSVPVQDSPLSPRGQPVVPVADMAISEDTTQACLVQQDGSLGFYKLCPDASVSCVAVLPADFQACCVVSLPYRLLLEEKGYLDEEGEGDEEASSKNKSQNDHKDGPTLPFAVWVGRGGSRVTCLALSSQKANGDLTWEVETLYEVSLPGEDRQVTRVVPLTTTMVWSSTDSGETVFWNSETRSCDASEWTKATQGISGVGPAVVFGRSIFVPSTEDGTLFELQADPGANETAGRVDKWSTLSPGPITALCAIPASGNGGNSSCGAGASLLVLGTKDGTMLIVDHSQLDLVEPVALMEEAHPTKQAIVSIQCIPMAEGGVTSSRSPTLMVSSKEGLVTCWTMRTQDKGRWSLSKTLACNLGSFIPVLATPPSMVLPWPRLWLVSDKRDFFIYDLLPSSAEEKKKEIATDALVKSPAQAEAKDEESSRGQDVEAAVQKAKDEERSKAQSQQAQLLGTIEKLERDLLVAQEIQNSLTKTIHTNAMEHQSKLEVVELELHEAQKEAAVNSAKASQSASEVSQQIKERESTLDKEKEELHSKELQELWKELEFYRCRVEELEEQAQQQSRATRLPTNGGTAPELAEVSPEKSSVPQHNSDVISATPVAATSSGSDMREAGFMNTTELLLQTLQGKSFAHLLTPAMVQQCAQLCQGIQDWRTSDVHIGGSSAITPHRSPKPKSEAQTGSKSNVSLSTPAALNALEDAERRFEIAEVKFRAENGTRKELDKRVASLQQLVDELETERLSLLEQTARSAKLARSSAASLAAQKVEADSHDAFIHSLMATVDCLYMDQLSQVGVPPPKEFQLHPPAPRMEQPKQQLQLLPEEKTPTVLRSPAFEDSSPLSKDKAASLALKEENESLRIQVRFLEQILQGGQPNPSRQSHHHQQQHHHSHADPASAHLVGTPASTSTSTTSSPSNLRTPSRAGGGGGMVITPGGSVNVGTSSNTVASTNVLTTAYLRIRACLGVSHANRVLLSALHGDVTDEVFATQRLIECLCAEITLHLPPAPPRMQAAPPAPQSYHHNQNESDLTTYEHLQARRAAQQH